MAGILIVNLLLGLDEEVVDDLSRSRKSCDGLNLWGLREYK
jgi:hypothetical protein